MVGAWLVATALAVGIGIGAVQLAGAQVTDDPAQALSADEVPTKPLRAQVTVPLPTTTTIPPSTTVPGSSPTTTQAGASATTAPNSPSTTVPGTASTTSTVPSTTAAPQSQVTVYQLIGGAVSIESSPGVVNLVWATPNAGFSAEVESAGPTNVQVEFESGSHKSKFRAEWSGGVLDIEQREEADD